MEQFARFATGLGRSLVVRSRVQVNDEKPEWSGIPQGSALGPLLFSIDTNDLHSGINNDTGKFVSDTKIDRQIRSNHDDEVLQDDLDTP